MASMGKRMERESVVVRTKSVGVKIKLRIEVGKAQQTQNEPARAEDPSLCCAS
jgi:hypothetical protein